MSLPVTCNWTKLAFIIEQKRGACLQATRASSGRLLSRLGMDCSLPENVFVAVKAAMVWALTHVVRPGLYIVRRNSLIDICFLRNQACMHEDISLVIFLWNFCRPVHCGSSALLAICLLELYTFKEGAS